MQQTRECQAMGGARAWKWRCGDAANATTTPSSNKMRLPAVGRGRTGAGAGTPASRMTEQIAQKSSARLAGLCRVGAVGASGKLDEGCIAHRSARGARTVFAGAVRGEADCAEMRSKCTCPNDRTSWVVSANSANHEPSRIRDRNRRIAHPSINGMLWPLRTRF